MTAEGSTGIVFRGGLEGHPSENGSSVVLISTPEKANGRITVKAFNTGSASVPTPRVTVKAQGFGSGAKLLKLFAVSADGKLKELQSAPCSDGGTVDFNAVYNRRETKSFELRLYDAQEKVIARLKRENA